MKGRLITIVIAALVSLSGLASAAWAQGSPTSIGMVQEDHFLTFNVPVALPNGTTLPAGTYLFRVTKEQRGITQVLSEDRSKTYATLATFTTLRDKTEGFDVIVSETAANTPPMLKAWFCSGSRGGHQFVAAK